MVNKVMRSSNPALFFSRSETNQNVFAIRKAEQKTSAEIRVHLESHFKGDGMNHTRRIFERLDMQETKDSNGVLILLGIRNHEFVILGDRGIYEKVSEAFWKTLADDVAAKLREDRFAEGLAHAIQKIGEILKTHFPFERDDKNELPDGVSHSL